MEPHKLTKRWREQMLKSVILRPHHLTHLHSAEDDFHCVGYHFEG
ncbi:hypothetical protein [Gynuella sp.]